MDYNSLSLGVELEFTGITRNDAIKVIAEHFGTTAEHIGDGYDTYTARDLQNREWKIMKDSSIRTKKKEGSSIISASDLFACELVTPILYASDIENLQEIIRKLRKAGGLTDSSCGIHVHISGKDFSSKQLRFLCNIFYSKCNLIYSAVKVDDKRLKYCRKFPAEFINELNTVKPENMDAFGDLWYKRLSSNYESMSGHYNSSRYHGLNLHNLFSRRQPTIEFRIFPSTFHSGEVKSYIQFCLLVVMQALTAKKASAKISVPVTGNSRYSFRVWLLKLGFIGDEFKTARIHLLKNLTGNTAWRDR